MSDGFGVVVIDDTGRVIDYSVPTTMPHTLLKEAVSFSYDVYRTVSVIVEELGYKLPKNISIKLDNYEVTIFKRYNRIVLVIVYEEQFKQPTRVVEEVVAQS